MLSCETLVDGKPCGHPLNVHNPCTATVGAGKKARLCGCQAFTPDDVKQRVASLTDNGDPRAAIAAALAGRK